MGTLRESIDSALQDTDRAISITRKYWVALNNHIELKKQTGTPTGVIIPGVGTVPVNPAPDQAAINLNLVDTNLILLRQLGVILLALRLMLSNQATAPDVGKVEDERGSQSPDDVS